MPKDSWKSAVSRHKNIKRLATSFTKGKKYKENKGLELRTSGLVPYKSSHTLKWGKYKGVDMWTIPEHYLFWLLDTQSRYLGKVMFEEVRKSIYGEITSTTSN